MLKVVRTSVPLMSVDEVGSWFEYTTLLHEILATLNFSEFSDF